MTLEDQVAQIAADVAAIKANPVAVDLTATNAAIATLQTTVNAIAAQFQATPVSAPAAPAA